MYSCGRMCHHHHHYQPRADTTQKNRTNHKNRGKMAAHSVRPMVKKKTVHMKEEGGRVDLHANTSTLFFSSAVGGRRGKGGAFVCVCVLNSGRSHTLFLLRSPPLSHSTSSSHTRPFHLFVKDRRGGREKWRCESASDTGERQKKEKKSRRWKKKRWRFREGEKGRASTAARKKGPQGALCGRKRGRRVGGVGGTRHSPRISAALSC